MAITLSSLTEEMLSKQERAVVRNIYRVGQLSEALASLEKSLATLNLAHHGSLDPEVKRREQCVANLIGYLKSAMLNTLVNTKVPGTSAQLTSTLNKTPE
jgi:hypothetical protein